MKTSTALMRIEKVVESGTANLRVRLRERALDEGMPRIWMESLEARRMLSDGFGVNGWSSVAFAGRPGSAEPIAVATAPGGKFYMAGCVEVTDASGYGVRDWALARFNRDGTPDLTFNKTGSETFSLGQWSCIDHVVVQDDGKFIVTGECENGLAVARFNEDGSLDTGFGGGARVYDVFNGFPIGMYTCEDAAWLTPDGKVMLVAQHGPDIVTVRLTSHGWIDTSFASGGAVSATVDPGGDAVGADTLLAAMPLPDGGVLAYVDVWSYPPDPANPGELNYDAFPDTQLMRVQLDAQGQLVSRKQIDVKLAPPDHWRGDAAPDYMLWLGQDGSAYFAAEAPDPRIQKLAPDGSTDLGFGDHGLAAVPGNYVQIRGLLADGRILVQSGVDDTLEWGQQAPEIILSADGSIDRSFNGGRQFGIGGDYVELPLSDGSVILGYTSGVDSREAPSFRLQKFSADGSIEPSATGIDLDALTAGLKAADVPFVGNDNGLFASSPGATVWDPMGDKDVWDDGSAGL